MKAIILAAGIGSRLGPSDLPKGLTLLSNGQTILGRQVELLLHHLPLSALILVVGFHQEKIKAAFPTIRCLENPEYAQENTSKSLLKALPSQPEDILWINGDVVFHPSVLATALKGPKTSMVVTQGAVDPEAVKYRTDAAGLILEVSKEVQNPMGEAIGINRFAAEDLPLFRSSLQACQPNDYFEKGIEMCIQQQVKVKSIPIPNDLCIEIDFPEDLKKAEALLTLWKQ